MDKNGKLFGKVSIFDLIIIALVIVVGVGTFYKFNSEATNVDGGQKTILYTLMISGVREFTLPYYEEGLRCFDTKSGEEIGTIKAVRSGPSTDYFQDQQGTIQLLEVPETVKVELDIETIGLETDKGYFARGAYELKAGSEVSLSTKYVEVTAVVENVQAQ